MSKIGYVLFAIVLFASLFVLVGTVASENANFVVQPHEERVITIKLQETDSFSGSFSVVSNDDFGVDFSISDPGNQTTLIYSNTKQKSFSFTAEMTGNYQLHFDNPESSELVKTVALNYNVTHYIMGLPQEQFFLVVIAIVALIGVVVYVALMPK